MKAVSKISGSSCRLRTYGPTKTVDFIDWLLCFEQIGLLRVSALEYTGG